MRRALGRPAFFNMPEIMRAGVIASRCSPGTRLACAFQTSARCASLLPKSVAPAASASWIQIHHSGRTPGGGSSTGSV